MQVTPLHEEHVALGAKMVDFAGWHMPVEYMGLRQEHETVRQKVGLFDVSHMGEIRIQGPQALATVEWLTTNYAGRLKSGQAQYSLLPYAEGGGLVDDIIVYCVEPGHEYLLCVNASNAAKDFAWIQAQNRGAEVINESANWGQIAVQGPTAMELAGRVLGASVVNIEPFHFAFVPFKGARLIVARTGYTGEDGVEIFVPTATTVTLWRELLRKGHDLGVAPIGLGARDTLRTEMKFPLYGHEIDATTNPYAAGLGWVVKPERKDFVGREVIVGGKEKGLARQLVGFKMLERGIPRQSYKLMDAEGRERGVVTSGTLSPTLNENIGIGYVDRECASIGTPIQVDIRGRLVKAEVVPTPFVKRKSI